MSEAGTEDITRLLNDWVQGDRASGDRLMAVIYDELRRISARQLRNAPTVTMQASELVAEAYLRLAGQRANWSNRSHFFAIAATVIRRLLLDQARARSAQRRDRHLEVPLDDHQAVLMSEQRAEELIEIDTALGELADFDAAKARLVELRYFSGLTIEETAQVLGTSVSTVKREWQIARAWLYRRLQDRLGVDIEGPADG